MTLIPEASWRLSSLLAYLEKRLESRGHCLIAVAEGAEALEQKEEREAHLEAKAVMQTPTTSVESAPGGVAAPSAPAAAAVAGAPSTAVLPAIKRDESGEWPYTLRSSWEIGHGQGPTSSTIFSAQDCLTFLHFC